ncbi:hypothetical protein HDK77DRAFT_226213 [Phyllosticta capitalensis]|uniref:uncharacterized protein n=1 Tax=Phyllosticta capitalensis TaxID=121624 RepID=UPI00312FA899
MTSRPPSALSLSAPVLDRRKVGDAPSPSPTRDRRRNVSAFDAAWPISPSATLKAFTEGVDSSTSAPNDQTLLASLSNASATEKDLGVRVASATHKIKAWCAELEQWNWPETFEEPPRQLDRIAEECPGSEGVRVAYWGSLPATRVQEYGERLDQIKDELDDLNMDELKGYILDMYPMDRWQSAPNDGKKRAELHLLDDFSYVVTHTMLQALPCLSYLNQLSRTWTMRVAVLRDVPKFLGGLKEAKKALRLGWDSLIPPKELEPSQKALAEWKEAAQTIRGVLETQVRSLGQKLDRMLDALEDMNDTLPDDWIDDFEGLEADYGKWCSEAQRRIFEADMLMSRPAEKLTRPTSARGADQPVPFGGSRLTSPRDSRFLSPEDSPFTLLSETSNDSPNLSERAAEPSPGINRSTTTFGFDSPSKHDRGHQRNRSSSVPQLHISPFKLAPKIRLETIEGTPTKSGSRAFTLHPEDIDSDEFEESGDSAGSSMAKETDAAQDRRAVSLAEPLLKNMESSGFQEDDKSSTPLTPLSPEFGRNQAKNEPFEGSDGMAGENAGRKAETVTSSDAGDDVLSAGTTPERDLRGSHRSIGSLRSTSSVGTPDDSPSVRVLPGRKTRTRPPLNAAMMKRREKGRQSSGMSGGVDSDDDSRVFERGSLSPTESSFRLARKNQHRRQSSATQDLEAQIRRIITSVHAPIHLSSGGDNSPTDWASRSTRTFSASRAGSRPPSSLRISRKPSTPAMILSPVKSDHGSGPRTFQQRDSGIKLYHLIQPGQDKPIKLFVRRVGPNGERVMVRVGGGWADLGEYLRQYVEHHSRRVVSDSKFEILGVEHTPEGVRPTSSHSNTGSNSKSKFLGTPATGNSNASASRSRPGSAMSSYSSRGREDFGNSVSSQRSWAGSEVGLAGPTAKKHDLSEEKLEWIEGMMNQARMLHMDDEPKQAPTKKMYVKHADKHGH